jgi:hypothetical protein
VLRHTVSRPVIVRPCAIQAARSIVLVGPNINVCEVGLRLSPAVTGRMRHRRDRNDTAVAIVAPPAAPFPTRHMMWGPKGRPVPLKGLIETDLMIIG